MCVVPAFVQNTVDSLPQYTVTTVTTNDVLISSLSTENSNVLNEITTIPEFDTTDKADRLLTTEINQLIISSLVPTKMFKGDDLHFDKNNIPDVTTIEPIIADGVTITEPSITLFDEYTTKNALSLSTERQENENKISLTSSTWIDSDEKTTPITTASINEENETDINTFYGVTSEPNFQTSTIPDLINTVDNFGDNSTQHSVSKVDEIKNTLGSVTSQPNVQINTIPNLKNNSDNFVEMSTQYSVSKKAETTSLHDENIETITFNDGIESTLTTTTDNVQALTTESTMDSTQLQQDSFKMTTSNSMEIETKYFNSNYDDNLLSTTITSGVSINPNLITESATKPQNKINIETTEFLENVTGTAVPIDESNELSSTTTANDFKTDITDDLINDIDMTTQNMIRGYDSNMVEITTKNTKENLSGLNKDNNNNLKITSTIFDSDKMHTSTDESTSFNQNESTESSTNSIISKTSDVTLNVDTEQAVLETTSTIHFIPSTVQSMSENHEVTTDNSNESMNSRTIYFDEENEIKNNAQSTTKSYSDISTEYAKNNVENNLTDNPNVVKFNTTTVPTELDNNLQVKNVSSFLETTTSNELPMSLSTINNQESTTLITLNELFNSKYNVTSDLNTNDETTTRSYLLTTTYNYLNENTNQYNENDQILTTKSSENIVDVFTKNTSDVFDEENELIYTTTNPTSPSMTTVKGIRIYTEKTLDDEATTISKIINDIDKTSINVIDEDINTTTVDTINKNKENDFTLVGSIETTLHPMTISSKAEIITSNNQIDEYTTVNGVVSNNSTEENTQRPIPTDENETAITVTTFIHRVTNESVGHPSNLIDTGDEVTTSAPEFTTQIVESSIVPGLVNINDSNVSQDIKNKWEMLLSGTGNVSVPSVSESSTVVGTRLTTVINDMEETVLNTEPTEAIVSKEIFTENHQLTNYFVNNDVANIIGYDLTTTVRTRGKNESVITSTDVADRDDTISTNEMYTMDNEVTTESDFERKNESIVSTQIQGDRTDNIFVGGDQTTQQIMTFSSINNTLFETTTANTPMATDSAIFTSKDTDFKNANRETTTVTIITMADWIKTKSTTPKESSNEINTEKSVENNLFNNPTDFNPPKNSDFVTTNIPLEPLAKTDDLDQIETSSIISINDATTMINLFTTSIEVLVSSLNTENDSTITDENIITTTNAVTSSFTENYETTTTTGLKKSDSANIPLNPYEIMYDLTTIQDNADMTTEFNNTTDSPTEKFTVLPTEETTFEFRTDSPYDTNLNNESTSSYTDQDTTDLNDNNNMLTTTEYTVTSKSIEIEDVTVIPTNHNQTNINNSYTVQQIITTATRKWCWNDTDCDAGHKCLAAKCLPTGESRVNNCPPGIITLQCLKGIIYT